MKIYPKGYILYRTGESHHGSSEQSFKAGEEKTLHSELIAQNNIDYSKVWDLLQGENSDIVELLDFKKRVVGRKDSFVVEIEADIKKKDGTISSITYYYDTRINEPTLFDPDQYDREQEALNDEPLAEN